jgi:hypothetical protein
MPFKTRVAHICAGSMNSGGIGHHNIEDGLEDSILPALKRHCCELCFDPQCLEVQ